MDDDRPGSGVPWASAPKIDAGVFELLFDQALDPVLLTVPDGSILRANAAAVRALGRSEAEICAAGRGALVVGDARLRALVAERDRAGAARGELTMLRRDGTPFPADVTSAILSPGPPPLSYVLFRDLTEQRRAAAELRASEERLRVLVENAPAAIALLDRDMRYLAHSRRFLSDYGVDGSVVGRSHYEVFPEIPARWREIHRRCLAGASERCPEEPFLRADGSVQWLRWEIVPWHDARGDIGGIVLFSEEITELKRADDALVTQKQLLTSIIDGTPSVVLAYDRNGRVTLANAAAARLYGTTKEALVGTSVGAHLAEALARDLAAQHAEVLLSGRLRIAELTLPLPDGERTLIVARYPLRDGSGTVYGTASVATDITDQKRAEAELRASEGRTFEAVVALERALEVARRTEEKLRQSQKMEAVGRLAGGIAHDFNNILTVILGTSGELVSELREGDPLREGILEIERAGKRAASMTRQLLAFSRKQVLEPRTVDVNAVLLGFETMLRRLIGEHVELVLLLQPRLQPCRLDPNQFEQAIINLAVNARDAMPDGGRLTIETANASFDAAQAEDHPGVTPGPQVRVSVTDTGVGMSAEVRAHVFEPFFTTKGVGAGTGLGLSTVYGFVRQSSGAVSVHSQRGQGTTFKLYFPAAGAEKDVEAPRPATPSPGRGTETILLVEDDEQVRTTVASMLRRAGYHVIPAANGGEALLACEQHGDAIHLLLTDVVMPGMNGPKLAERLRQVRPRLRMIFMSGYAEDAVVHHGVFGPGLDFLAKPATSDALLSKVRDALDR